MLGDNGEVTYVAITKTGAGLALRYETTDTLSVTGGNLSIDLSGYQPVTGPWTAYTPTLAAGSGTPMVAASPTAK